MHVSFFLLLIVFLFDLCFILLILIQDVYSDDILLPTLTIKETLMYAACTRMEGNSTLAERTQRVNYLIDLFGLVNEQNHFVGRRGKMDTFICSYLN